VGVMSLYSDVQVVDEFVLFIFVCELDVVV
jgi:hypothetical protein